MGPLIYFRLPPMEVGSGEERGARGRWKGMMIASSNVHRAAVASRVRRAQRVAGFGGTWARFED
jgi:hypothetical protein